MAPSPSERERVGVRVRVCSRIIRAKRALPRTPGGGLGRLSAPPLCQELPNDVLNPTDEFFRGEQMPS